MYPIGALQPLQSAFARQVGTAVTTSAHIALNPGQGTSWVFILLYSS